MPNRRKFNELTSRWSADRRERVEERVSATLAELELLDLMKARGLKQTDIGTQMDLAQGNVSRILRRSDMRISTLRQVVEAMGGELEVVARFPEMGALVAPFSAGTTRKPSGSKSEASSGAARIARVAGKVPTKGKPAPAQAKKLTRSAFSKAPDKPKGGGK